jgi:hypothetical protein
MNIAVPAAGIYFTRITAVVFLTLTLQPYINKLRPEVRYNNEDGTHLPSVFINFVRYRCGDSFPDTDYVVEY